MFRNKKRLMILLVTIALIATISVLSLVSLYTAGLPGDVSQDGKVTGRDAVALLKYCAGWSLKLSEERADVNADGKVNGKDAILLLKYLAGWNVELKMAKSQDVLDFSKYSGEIKDNWRKTLVGDPDESIVHSETYLQMAKRYSDASKAMWDLQKRDITLGYPYEYGGDPAYVDAYYINLCTMTKGYCVVGGELYHNKDLLADIIKGLEYGYENYYGQEVIAKGTVGNWWEWEIGTPRQLICILVMLENELSAEDISRYLACFDHLVPVPYETAGSTNKLWYCYCVMGAALLEEDGERMLNAKKDMLEVLDYVNSGDGFYTDGSFIFHGAYSYTGGYGYQLMLDLSTITLMFRGTHYDFTNESINNQYKWVLESFQPIIYDGNLFAATCGRSVGIWFSEKSTFNTFMVPLINMSFYAPEEYKPALETLLRTYMKEANSDFAELAPLQCVDYVVELYNDDSVPLRESYNIFKDFDKMARVVQQNERYAACLAFSTTSIAKYEALTENVNTNAWYHSDGALFIYTDGYDYTSDYFQLINPYRIAGTTVSTAPRVNEVMNFKYIYNSSDFVGSVSSGGYGIALYKLGYAQNKVYNSDIQANKSYFLFDNEIVCVGSDINETSDYSLETVIENRFIRSGDIFTVNGEEYALTDTDTPVTAKYLHFSNMGGYVMPEATELNVRRNDNNSYSFLEIVQKHGVNPNGAEYAYILLPEATEEETKDYSDNPDVEILACEKNLHIVKENKLNSVGYAFYDAGEGEGVSASRACGVLVTYGDDGKITVCVSDIAKESKNIELKLNLGASEVISADSGLKTKCEGDTVTVYFNGKVNQGGTYTLVLK